MTSDSEVSPSGYDHPASDAPNSYDRSPSGIDTAIIPEPTPLGDTWIHTSGVAQSSGSSGGV